MKRYTVQTEYKMKSAKAPAAPTSFRLTDDVRRLLQRAAEKERRSQTGMLEVMVQQWCETHDVTLRRRGAK